MDCTALILSPIDGHQSLLHFPARVEIISGKQRWASRNMNILIGFYCA